MLVLNSIHDKVHDLLVNGVVPTSIVIGSIFPVCDELFRVEELVVGTSTNFINDCGFQVFRLLSFPQLCWGNSFWVHLPADGTSLD